MAVPTAIERPVRCALVLSLIPALALLIPAGTLMRFAFFGFIGVGFSVITSTIYLLRERLRSRSTFTFAATQQDESRPWGFFDYFTWVMDVATFATYLGLLIPLWIQLEDSYDWRWTSGSRIMTVTYSTVPLMSNMVIHLLLFLANARTAIRNMPARIISLKESLRIHECPNCHHKMTGEAKGKEKETVQKGEGYSLLRGEEYDEDVAGRASEDTVTPNVLDV